MGVSPAPRRGTPRFVYIFGRRVRVRHFERTTDITGDLANGLLGEAMPDSDIINIAHESAGDPVGRDSFTDTLLHECLHMLIAVGALQDTLADGDDERFVKRFSPMLLDFIRRNPELVRWLQRRD